MQYTLTPEPKRRPAPNRAGFFSSWFLHALSISTFQSTALSRIMVGIRYVNIDVIMCGLG